MKHKKLLALGMASLMVISTVGTAFAADTTDPTNASGTIEGNGGIVGFVDKEVFTVSLPTTAALDFTIDPQELLLVGESSANLDGSQIATGYAGKVLFKDTTNYLTKSKDITVVNKSTYDVDVTLDVKVEGLSKEGEDGYTINLVDPSADGYAAGTNTDISLAVTPTTGTSTNGAAIAGGVAGTATVITDADKTTVKTTVAALSDISQAYEVKYSNPNYSYALKGDVSSVAFNAVTYNISGTVNTAADWTNFNKDASKALKTTVTYKVEKHETYTNGSTINAKSGASALAFEVALPGGASAVKAVTVTTSAGKTYTTSGTISAGSVVLNDSNTKWFLSTPGTYTVKITFEGAEDVYTLPLVISSAS